MKKKTQEELKADKEKEQMNYEVTKKKIEEKRAQYLAKEEIKDIEEDTQAEA